MFDNLSLVLRLALAASFLNLITRYSGTFVRVANIACAMYLYKDSSANLCTVNSSSSPKPSDIYSNTISLLFKLSIFLYCSLTFSIINSYWGYPLFTAIKCDRIGHFCNIMSAMSYFIVIILLITFREITVINAVICIVIADFIGAVLKLTFALNKKILP